MFETYGLYFNAKLNVVRLVDNEKIVIEKPNAQDVQDINMFDTSAHGVLEYMIDRALVCLFICVFYVL